MDGSAPWIAVLTAADPLPDQAIAAVRQGLHGQATLIGTAKRRSDHAAEIPFRAGAAPARAPSVPGVDVAFLPVARRAKTVLIADMDSTMIGVECIDELADFAGVKPQVAEITERAMAGDLDFEQALEARVALLKGLPEAALQDCYDQRVRLNPGAEALVRTMAARGAHTALISGGFTFFTARVARAAGFHEHQANVLQIEGGRLTGRVAKPILGREAKLAALHRICAEHGASPADVVAIGDGANDLAMIAAAGLGIAYRAKAPALRDGADAILDHSDLDAALALQGIDPA